ncbi:MAG TPA: glycoside hydrolase family 44 protein [Terracidiphilus sp.]|nr:glycoside hydrolase family 44 protein [Terracidiphilus sp.]
MKSLFLFLIGCICFVFLPNGCGSGGNNSSSGPVTPTVTVTPASSSIRYSQSLSVTVAVSGANGTPTGSVVLSSGSYTSSAATLSSGSAIITIPAGSLAAGSDSLTAKYTPDSGSEAAYYSASGAASITVTQPATTPTVTVTPASSSITTAQSLSVTIAVSGSSGTPTGSIVLSSGSYTSSATTLSSSSATITIPAGSLATGSDTLIATYTPDSNSSATYNSASGTGSITVTAGSTAVTVNIDVLANRHQISPFVYGNNDQTIADISDVGYTYSRWGGNDASNYNWQLQTRNSVADWYFEDYGGAGDQVQLITNTQNAGSHALTTMAMMDWVAGEAENSSNRNWSYSVAIYGAQCSVDPNNTDAGDGLETDCKTPVTTNAVTTAYYPLVDTAPNCPAGTASQTTCIDRKTWAKALATAFGSGTCTVPYSPIASCHFYDMDNEPDIWNGTHRDVHPVASGYDELANLYETEATNLKAWDPAAVRFGPVFCCWWFYWNGANGNDKAAHGGIDFLPWWLNQIYWFDQINGARTLDVFDIHAYADCGPTTNFTNAQLQAATVKCAGYYWDPATVNPDMDNTWTANEEPNPGIPFHIPRFKAMVNAIYPGTPLSYTEWGAGLAQNAGSDFSTAIADADTLGVFGREGLSFASRWDGPSPGTAEYEAWKLYTNYDGAHHMFEPLSISAANNGNSDLFSSFASLNSTGTTMTIMVLNKDPQNTAQVTFNLSGFSASSYVAYTLASTASSAISHSSSAAWNATQSFAPYSITLLVVNGSEASTPASEWRLNPDDLMIPASGAATLNPAISSGSATVTLSSAVFDAYEGAPACSGSLALTNSTMTATQPATITVNAGSAPGFCHFTVTGFDGTATQTQGGWIVVGNPPATLTVTGGNNQTGTAGTTLSNALTVTLAPGQSGGSTTGAGILFTTSAGTLSNGTTSGTSVIATTSSSGIASVTLTLPSSKGTVTVTAQDQFALGGASVTFTETAN